MNATSLLNTSKLDDPLCTLIEHFLKEETLEDREVCTENNERKNATDFPSEHSPRGNCGRYSVPSIHKVLKKTKCKWKTGRLGMSASERKQKSKGNKKNGHECLNDSVVQSFAKFRSGEHNQPTFQTLISSNQAKTFEDHTDPRHSHKDLSGTCHQQRDRVFLQDESGDGATSQSAMERIPDVTINQRKRVRFAQEDVTTLKKYEFASSTIEGLMKDRVKAEQVDTSRFQQRSPLSIFANSSVFQTSNATTLSNTKTIFSNENDNNVQEICAQLETIDLDERKAKRQRLPHKALRAVLIRERTQTKPPLSMPKPKWNHVSGGENSTKSSVESWMRPSLNPFQDGFTINYYKGNNEREMTKAASNKNHEERKAKVSYSPFHQESKDLLSRQQLNMASDPSQEQPQPLLNPESDNSSEPTKKLKTRKNRKKKDNSDGRPKQPLSAYNIFFKDERNRILSSMDPSLNTSQSSIDSATVAEPEAFEGSNSTSVNSTKKTISEKDSAEVTRSGMKEETETSLSTRLSSETTKSEDYSTAAGKIDSNCSSSSNNNNNNEIEEGEEESKPVKKRRGRPRGPNYVKPKPPHRKITFQRLAQIIGGKWKQRTPEIIAEYNRRAKLDRKRYDAELAVFNAKHQKKKQQQKQESDDKKNDSNTEVKDTMDERAVVGSAQYEKESDKSKNDSKTEGKDSVSKGPVVSSDKYDEKSDNVSSEEGKDSLNEGVVIDSDQEDSHNNNSKNDNINNRRKESISGS